MATVSQTHRNFDGRGQLSRDGEAPINVHYHIVLSARPIAATALSGPQETIWEWDKAEGHVRLVSHSDWTRVDLNQEYTLVLDDGRHCPVGMGHHSRQPATTFSVKCSPADLVSVE